MWNGKILVLFLGENAHFWLWTAQIQTLISPWYFNGKFIWNTKTTILMRSNLLMKIKQKISHFRQCLDQRWWIFNPPILRLLHVEYKQNLVGMRLNLICVKCLPLFYMHIMTFQHLLICFLHLSTAPSCISYQNSPIFLASFLVPFNECYERLYCFTVSK